MKKLLFQKQNQEAPQQEGDLPLSFKPSLLQKRNQLPSINKPILNFNNNQNNQEEIIELKNNNSQDDQENQQQQQNIFFQQQSQDQPDQPQILDDEINNLKESAKEKEEEKPKKKMFLGGLKKNKEKEKENEADNNKDSKEKDDNNNASLQQSNIQGETKISSKKLNSNTKSIKFTKFLKRKVRSPRIIYAFLMWIFGFYSLAISTISFVNMNSINFDFSQIVSNLKTDPIISIREAGAGQSCQSNEEIMFQYEWQGTVAGCSCVNVPSFRLKQNGLQATVYRQDCNDVMKKAACTQISAQNSQNLTFWDKNGGKLTICYQRLKGYNFAEKGPQNQLCDDLKACNPQYVDTMYCVPDTQDCPINQIVISKTNPNPFIFSLSDAIQLNSTHSLWTTRLADSLPIMEFQVQEGAGVCKDKQPNITPGRSEYVLMTKNRNVCQNLETRYTKLMHLGEKTYFDKNPVKDTIAGLPLYQYNDTYTYRSYYRTYIPWKMAQRSQVQQFINYQLVVQQKFKLQIAIIFFSCLLVLMLSLGFVTLEVYNIFDKDIPCMSGDTSDFSNRVKGYKRLYNFMPKLINYLLMIFLFSYSTAIQTTFQNLKTAQPSDQETNEYLTYIADNYSKIVYVYDLQLVIVHIVIFVIDIFRFGTYAITSLFEKPETQKSTAEQEKENKANVINIFTHQNKHSFANI